MDIRTFIAFETPENIRNHIKEVQDQFKSTNADVRWEPSEKFHITIKFLGNVNDTILPTIIDSISNVCKEYQPFEVRYENIGFFPNKRNPRVIWVGCTDLSGALNSLKKRFDEILIPFGFDIEKRTFHPHVTLGRMKSTKNINNLISLVEKITFNPVETIINEIVFMKSTLFSHGSQYSVLKIINLPK